MNDKLNKCITYSIIVFLIVILFNSFMVCLHKIYLIGFSYFLMMFGVFFLLCLLVLIKNKKIVFQREYIFLIILTLFLIISTVLSKDVKHSLFGSTYRGEGALVILSYYLTIAFSSLVSSDKHRKTIIYCLYGFGIIQLIFGILQLAFPQVLSSINFVFVSELASGLVGNTNFFSSIMVMCLSLAIGGYITNETSWIWIIPFAVGQVLTNCLSGYLALAILLLFLLIMAIISAIKKHNKYYIFKIAIILFIGFLSFVSVREIIPSYSSLVEKDLVNTSNQVTENKSGRIYLWSNTLKQMDKYWLHGVGTDNFYLIFDEPLIDGINNYRIDKVHNEYLQIFVSEGIFALLAYVALIIYVLIKNKNIILMKKNEFNSIRFMLLCASCTYLMQAFVGISNIRVSILFYIILGLLISYSEGKCKK